MQRYSKEDLERCDWFLDRACNEILRQQTIIDQLTELDGLGPACDALESAMEAAVLCEEERILILEALSSQVEAVACFPNSMIRKDFSTTANS